MGEMPVGNVFGWADHREAWRRKFINLVGTNNFHAVFNGDWVPVAPGFPRFGTTSDHDAKHNQTRRHSNALHELSVTQFRQRINSRSDASIMKCSGSGVSARRKETR